MTANAARILVLPIDALVLSNFSRADTKRATLAAFLAILLRTSSGNSSIIPQKMLCERTKQFWTRLKGNNKQHLPKI